MERQEIRSKSVIDTLNNHVTIREYLDKPIPDDLLFVMLNAARRAPTSSNLQAYSFVVVKDPVTKRKLAELAGNQRHIETSAVFVAICADISRLEKACAQHDESLGKNLESTLVASVDAALAGMSLATVAESYGLGTCMIGGMRNHPKEVAELLNFPTGVYCVFGMTIGWPDYERVRQQKPRMAEDLIIHLESYNGNQVEHRLMEYDHELAEHYRSQERNTPDAAWTGIISKRFSTGRRPHLRSTLENLGFGFE
jgi:nitroreductase